MGLFLGALGIASLGCAGGDAQSGANDEGIVTPSPYPRPAYIRLSETGLFSSAPDELERNVVRFAPSYELWSDGAEKRRWVALPNNTLIDTTDMNHWVLPIGTRLWKEFSLDGVRLETRLIERYGEGPDDYFFGSFVWSADQSDAVSHNPAGYCNYPGMELRLKIDETVPELTALWQTVVGRPAMFPESATERVAPGAQGESAIIERMSARGGIGMPFLATELVDHAGVATVSAWISALP